MNHGNRASNEATDRLTQPVVLDPATRGRDYTPLTAWLLSVVLAGRYDTALASGVRATPGSTLAVHAWRITSATQRRALGASLRRCLHESASSRPPLWTAHVTVDRDGIRSAEQLIDALAARLDAQGPVSACGVAKLRVLLSEGHGPVYRHGQGDLHGRLAAVLAVL